MRGDRPDTPPKGKKGSEFTPHARGSTCAVYRNSGVGFVYPACAGIDPALLGAKIPEYCLPRMRGDRPVDYHSGKPLHRFTPHARGSTWTFY